MRRWLAVLISVLAIGWSAPALAWGDGGHRTVCEIAAQNLTPTARAAVDRLLKANAVILGADPHYAGFGWACTYPDHVIPNGPGRRSPEHYVTYPRTLAAITGPGCPEAPACVLSAIPADEATLRSAKASDADKAVALIFLGHWVGDLHMPLHASYADDHEGSEIDAKGLCETSLHWTWDNCIFEARVFPGRRGDDVIRSLADAWTRPLSPRTRARWRNSEPWQWAAESYALARDPRAQYCVMVGPACQYSDALAVWDKDQPHKIVQIDAAYMDYAMPIIQRRLTMAGIRLADRLNRIFDKGYRG